MTQLHTVNSSGQLADCCRFLSAGDAIILIEDGVYCLDQKSLSSIPDSVAVYYLQEDTIARGIDPAASERVSGLDYSGFVTLCTQHAKVINWF